MSMLQLALQNFKLSFKNYISLIISLAFTILIFFNFQNIVDSKAIATLGKMNTEKVEILVQACTIVLVCFMIFFIWYSTNVFLNQRKKEIGIYIFMGLTNQKIGMLYMIETSLIGIIALVIGLVLGVITAQLFQMMLLTLSDISVNIQFEFSLSSMIKVAMIDLIIYFVFVLKGYINIVRSSVLEMVSATRKNEFVKVNDGILILKTILGIGILLTGYYLAIKKGGMETLNNALLAVVLVIVGVYLLFGGFIPFIFQTLAKRKTFLYKKERNLWINNIIFRMRKNYRTYAITTVLMVCSVTALATGFAMRNKYDSIQHFRTTYTYQVMSDQANLYHEFLNIIEEKNDVEYGTEIKMLQLPDDVMNSRFEHVNYGILAYSQLRRLAMDAQLPFDLKEPGDNEYIDIDQLYLMTLITDVSQEHMTINGKEYQITEMTNQPYLGYFQEQVSFYVVNDEEFKQIQDLGQIFYLYNYKIADIYNFNASKDALSNHDNCIGLVTIDPQNSEIEWVKILYSLCIFMFMVFILASGSILFMKLYNDAFADQTRYVILNKLGVDNKKLKQVIAHELRFTYVCPLIMMAISSFFSVKALAQMMMTDLLMMNIISVMIVVIFFYICYKLSFIYYYQNIHSK